MNNKRKGYTLAELLIVMAIILVLAAIIIPRFTAQAEMSRETADISALRAAYSEAMSDYLLNPSESGKESVTGVKLVSSGKLEYAKAELPFAGADELSIKKGEYTVTFDFSEENPSVSITLEKEIE